MKAESKQRRVDQWLNWLLLYRENRANQSNHDGKHEIESVWPFLVCASTMINMLFLFLEIYIYIYIVQPATNDVDIVKYKSSIGSLNTTQYECKPKKIPLY